MPGTTSNNTVTMLENHTFHISPVRIVCTARSGRPAPRFCPTSDAHAKPIDTEVRNWSASTRFAIPTIAIDAAPKRAAERAKREYTTENIIPMIAAGSPTRASPHEWIGSPARGVRTGTPDGAGSP